jgi:hypothetical protein
MVTESRTEKQPVWTTICPHHQTSVRKPRHFLHTPHAFFALWNNFQNMRHHGNTTTVECNEKRYHTTFPLKTAKGCVLHCGCVLAIGYLRCGCFMENAETWVNAKPEARTLATLISVIERLEYQYCSGSAGTTSWSRPKRRVNAYFWHFPYYSRGKFDLTLLRCIFQNQ